MKIKEKRNKRVAAGISLFLVRLASHVANG